MADIHTWNGEPTEDELELMREQLRLYIFPNVAETDEQKEAFEQATVYQIAHEKSLLERFSDIPDMAKSFRIGDFQMSLDDDGNGLNNRTICPAARSLLLRNGLLYRGLEGRCSKWR